MTDVVATQRLVVDLLLDGETRREWSADPEGFASARAGDARGAGMLAALSRTGVEAAALSNSLKKDRSDTSHRLRHERQAGR